jgi:hypothetical protein
MAIFTVRIELFKASERDYGTLQTAMENAGFGHTIKSKDGTVYHMPTSEYNRIGKLKIAAVLSAARKAAATTSKDFAVFVNEVVSRKWIGLPVFKE